MSNPADPTAAANHSASLLIEPDWLAEHLHDADLRIVDATVFLEPAPTGYRARSGVERYREGHVPGAAFMDLIERFSDRASGLGFTRPAPDALAIALGALGIAPEHRVVLYCAGHMMWATRAFWLLRYAGHRRVAVLNGGLAGWRDAGLAVTTGDESYPATRFVATPEPGWFVDLDATRSAMGDPAVCTVNALAPEVYAGTSEHHYGRPGHIPGSRSLHYDRLLDGQRFRSAAELRRVLDDSGMLDADRVITYCGGGISATIDAFACLLVGKHEIAVYDGSMSEWVRDPSLPLVTGPDP